jgi:hypothetical protein
MLIPKKNGKTRPLGIPAMKCRVKPALHLLAMEPTVKNRLDVETRSPQFCALPPIKFEKTLGLRLSQTVLFLSQNGDICGVDTFIF